MISAFVGQVGGGKSFCSVRRMCSYMATGGRCASNIELTGWDNELNDLRPDSPVIDFLRSLGWNYQPRQYVYISYDIMVADSLWYQKIPAGISRDKRTLCVVDEATDLFDSLDANKLRQDSGYRGLFHFLRLSRHAHIDVLFIAQDIDSINSRLRGLISNMWKSTDMKNYRIHGFKIKFPFDVFCLQLFDRRGKYELKREWVKKDPRIFTLYQSEVFGGALGVKWDGVAVADGRISEQEKKKGKKMTKMQFVVLVAVLVAGFFFLSSGIQSGGDSIAKALKGVKFPASSSPVYPAVPASVASAGRSGASDAKADDSPADTSLRIVRGHYRYFRGASPFSAFALFDDLELRLHWFSEWGAVVEMDERGIICKDEKGRITALLPNIPDYQPPKVHPISPSSPPVIITPLKHKNSSTNTPPATPHAVQFKRRGVSGGLVALGIVRIRAQNEKGGAV